jgi:hypothetical protein
MLSLVMTSAAPFCEHASHLPDLLASVIIEPAER